MPEAIGQLVLVVEDDPKTVTLVQAYLSRAGYEVVTAGDGLSALRMLREREPSLMVLDLMLPRLDGLTLTRIVREESDVPILMLTARSGVQDRLAGFSRGADDYLVKPFAPSELVARVAAVLRRGGGREAQRAPPRVLRFGDITLDREHLRVTRAGQMVELRLVEFRLLEALIAAQGRVLSRDLLLDGLTGRPALGVLPRSVDVYVSRLRRQLGDAARRPRYIATVRGVGYRALVPSQEAVSSA